MVTFGGVFHFKCSSPCATAHPITRRATVRTTPNSRFGVKMVCFFQVAVITEKSKAKTARSQVRAEDNSQAFTNLPAWCQNKFSPFSPSFPQTFPSLQSPASLSLVRIPRPSTIKCVGRSNLQPSNARPQKGVQKLCHQATSCLGLFTCS